MELRPQHQPALFLDRDGVINERIVGGYVTRWEEFHWLPGVLEALRHLAVYCHPIVVVTNQQGVGKGLMSEKALADIHNRMIEEIAQAGGRIDSIFTCTSLASTADPRRKPGVGMYLDAVEVYPSLPWQQKMMVGDTFADMQFGQAAGMECIWIDHQTENIPDRWFNHRFSGLLTWCEHWLKNQ